MNVLFACSELYPFIKTGGLSDVSYALPKALSNQGIDISIVIPFYSAIRRELYSIEFVDSIEIERHTFTLHKTFLPNTKVPVYLVKCDALFNRDGGPYGNALGDYPDNHVRFYFFSRVVTWMLNREIKAENPFTIVHCNDWQTGLIPLMVKDQSLPISSVFTIHNMAYGGIFSKEKLDELTLPDDIFHHDKIEFYGSISYLKAGLVYADQLTTVSPSYAKEIQDPEFGCGFDGLMRLRKDNLKGILNGIDKEDWNPAVDPAIPYNYDNQRLNEKIKNKAYLQQMVGLPAKNDIPLFSLVGRLVEQKGIEFVIDAIPIIVELGGQIVILGQGQAEYESTLLALAHHYPSQVWIKIGYDEELAHLIEAASDIFLMPSIFEPCGLNQLYSLAYGTIPIVSPVGGLHDTVIGFTGGNLLNATGFVLKSVSSIELIESITLACEVFQQKTIWETLQKNALQANFGWEVSASQYITCYRDLSQKII